MSQGQRKICLLGMCALMILTAAVCGFLRSYTAYQNRDINKNTYFELPSDPYTEDPLIYIERDFTVRAGFRSNLPIVILSMEG